MFWILNNSGEVQAEEKSRDLLHWRRQNANQENAGGDSWAVWSPSQAGVDCETGVNVAVQIYIVYSIYVYK